MCGLSLASTTPHVLNGQDLCTVAPSSSIEPAVYIMDESFSFKVPSARAAGRNSTAGDLLYTLPYIPYPSTVSYACNADASHSEQLRCGRLFAMCEGLG